MAGHQVDKARRDGADLGMDGDQVGQKLLGAKRAQGVGALKLCQMQGHKAAYGEVGWEKSETPRKCRKAAGILSCRPSGLWVPANKRSPWHSLCLAKRPGNVKGCAVALDLALAQYEHGFAGMGQHMLGLAAQQQALDALATV